jgi:hypothetical protein
MNRSSTAEQQPDTGIPGFDWLKVTWFENFAHIEHALLVMNGGLHTAKIGR